MKQVYFLLITTIIAIASFAQTKHTLYKPGQTFRDCPNCPEMVVIPSGRFIIGSPDNEAGRSLDPPLEGPQTLVHIKQFAAGKFDITKEQWAAFVKATNRPAGGNCGWAKLPGEASTQPGLPNPAANWNHVGFAQDRNTQIELVQQRLIIGELPQAVNMRIMVLILPVELDLFPVMTTGCTLRRLVPFLPTLLAYMI